MMGATDKQPNIFHTVQIEDLVPEDHPLRKIRERIDTKRIRQLCKPFYCKDNGRPSIPPEQLFLALVGGFLLGTRSDRKLIMELQCNMAFRWFVGLDIDSPVWHPTTFSKNREHRFDESGVLEHLFDDTIKLAMSQDLVSEHWSVDGTLVRADASHKSFVPIEVYQSPEDYKNAIRGKGKKSKDKDNDRSNPSKDWQGQKRSNKTHQSKTDPDCRLAAKSFRDGAQPSYTVNGIMENRSRILIGIGVERFRGPASERDGILSLIDRAKRKLKITPISVGGDKGYFEKKFIQGLFQRKVHPHIATHSMGKQKAHVRVRMRRRGKGYQLSQRARKKIEELWGEAKDLHGLRRFARRTLDNVRQEALLIGWLLNLKRLASHLCFDTT